MPPKESKEDLLLLLSVPGNKDSVATYLRERVLSTTSPDELLNVLVDQYRRAVERSGTNGTITLQDLEGSNPAVTVFTEVDFVDLVVFEFLKNKVTSVPLTIEEWAKTVVAPNSTLPRESTLSSLTNILVSFFTMLLQQQIYPHKKAQICLTGLCVASNDLQLLRQLVHFHVLLDSQEIAEILTAQSSSPWCVQSGKDMLWRLKDGEALLKLVEKEKGSSIGVCLVGLLKQKSFQLNLGRALEVLEAKLEHTEFNAVVDVVVDALQDAQDLGNVGGSEKWIDIR